VVLYADSITGSIRAAMEKTERRRALQKAYNDEHGIVPRTIKKPIRDKEVEITDIRHIPRSEIPNVIIQMQAEMHAAAERLEFERAIDLRDTVKRLERVMVETRAS